MIKIKPQNDYYSQRTSSNSTSIYEAADNCKVREKNFIKSQNKWNKNKTESYVSQEIKENEIERFKD